MKLPDRGRRPQIIQTVPALISVVILLLFCFAAVVLASSGHEGGTKGWVATDTYRVMNFAVLFIALFVLVRKPVAQALDDRIKGIKKQLVELETKKREAEKQLAAYNEKFAQLDQEAEKLIDEYIRQGNEAKARILAEAQSAAEKLEEQARRNIEQEFKKVKSKLKQEILEKALEKAEELVKRKITAEDQEKLVDDYLEKVVA
jgi:F-type H+-transporting ATPase subunit b